MIFLKFCSYFVALFFACQSYAKNSFFQYDNETGKIKTTIKLKNALCYKDKKYSEERELFLKLSEYLQEEQSHPLQPLYNINNMAAYESYRKLALIASTSDLNLEKLISAIYQLQRDLYNTSLSDETEKWILKVIAVNATPEFVRFFLDFDNRNTLNRRINFRFIMSDFADMAYYMNPQTLETYANYVKEEGSMYWHGDQPMDDAIESLNEPVSSYSYLAYQSIAQIGNIRVKQALNQSTGRNEQFWMQLRDLIDNLLPNTCGDVNPQNFLMSWCIDNDGSFLLSLANIAKQANETAKLMRDGAAKDLNHGIVVFNGNSCEIHGHYYLLKTDDNTVILKTSGDLIVARSNNIERALFRPVDLYLAVSNTDFKLEDK